MTESLNDPTTEYEDVITAFQYMLPVSIDWDAYKFLTPPYRSMFYGEMPGWTAPTDDELWAHLLKTWDVREVDEFFERRAVRQLERLRRDQWEASFWGRVVLRYRRVTFEVRERVSTAWNVLRHGVSEDDE